MKNIKQVYDDLRPEYRRSDFGEMVIGKHAFLRLEIAEFVRIYIACIGEDADLKFTRHESGDTLADRNSGDWTYEFDAADQITLRYWLDESTSIEEKISTPPSVTTPRERAELQDLITKRVKNLKSRAIAANPPTTST